MTGVHDPRATHASNLLVGRAAERAAIEDAPPRRRAWRPPVRSCSVVRPASASRRWSTTRSRSHPASESSTSSASSPRWGSGTPPSTNSPCSSTTASTRSPNRNESSSTAVLGNADHGALDPFRVGLAVLGLAEEAARAQPVLAVIDDAQWVDDESAMALSFVGRRLRAERVASLLTVRDTPDALRRGSKASAGHARRAVATRGSRAADRSGLKDRLTRSSPASSSPRPDGNPLALVELPAVLTPEQLRGAVASAGPVADRRAPRRCVRVAGGVRSTPARGRCCCWPSAERLGDPTLLRRAADVIGDRVVGRGRHERRGERARHLRPEGRVPPSARAVRRLLRRACDGSSARPRCARRGARYRSRRRSTRVAPRRRGRDETGREHRPLVGGLGGTGPPARRRVGRGVLAVARRRADAGPGTSHRTTSRGGTGRARRRAAARARSRSSIRPERAGSASGIGRTRRGPRR